MYNQLAPMLSWYTKPTYRDFKTFMEKTKQSREQWEITKTVSIETDVEDMIPSELSLEQVLADKTESPMTLHDFYMYLKHVECSQENLEFYTWYKEYEKRYSETSASSISSSSTFTDIEDNCIVKTVCETVEYEEVCSEKQDVQEFARYVEYLVLNKQQKSRRPGRRTWARPFSFYYSDSMALKKYTNQLELLLIADVFLREGSPKQLNLPPTLRKRVLASIAASDSPENIAPVTEHVLCLLRSCSFPNFVSLGVSNGTTETVCIAAIIGSVLGALGFLTMFLVAFTSPHVRRSSRWRGLAAAPLWFLGLLLLIASCQGCCFFLLAFGRRQRLPWERIDQEDDTAIDSTTVSNPSRLSLLRRLMIFDKKVSVKNRGLRKIQRCILLQSVLGAMLLTTVVEGLFLCLPIWKR